MWRQQKNQTRQEAMNTRATIFKHCGDYTNGSKDHFHARANRGLWLFGIVPTGPTTVVSEPRGIGFLYLDHRN